MNIRDDAYVKGYIRNLFAWVGSFRANPGFYPFSEKEQQK